MRTIRKTFNVVLVTTFLLVGFKASAQMVDRAVFEQHRAKARSLTTQRNVASAPITLTQNPFEIEEFIEEPGKITKQVKVYFNTAVMTNYRNECCPRMSEFDLMLPSGYKITAVSPSDALSSQISVYGNFEEKLNTLHFLAYGLCTASEMAQLPTGRIHYATLTLQNNNASVGNYSMTMSDASFAMADEPMDFIIDGTFPFEFKVAHLATGISLDITSATINNGETLQLTATVSPSNVTNPAVTWTSSNTNVATVSSSGFVAAKRRGTVTITATTADGSNLSATCEITVNQLATSVTLSQTSADIVVGETLILVATIRPDNATNKTLTWASSVASVATADDNGVITAVGVGQCDITATTTDGSNLSASCHVVVTNGGGVVADNYLSAADIDEVVAGQSFVIPIALTNQDPITAIQADMYLPNGVIVPDYNDDDEFVVLEPSRMGRGHSVATTVTQISTRILASSSRNAAFQGNEGTVMYIYLKMAENAGVGIYGIDLKNIRLTTTSGQLINAPDVVISVGAVAYHGGDANGDGYVDDTDYAITVNYLLGQTSSDFKFEAADVSGDGYVLVNDLPMIIDAALAYDFGASNAPRRDLLKAAANNKMYVNDFDLGGNATKTLNIVLDNATAFAAVQCDIELPTGLSIVEQTDEWGDLAYALPVAARFNGHESWTDLTGLGNVRLIIASSSNKSLRSTSGAVATFKVRSAAGFSGEHELVLKNIVCADANAVRYALPDAVCLINHAANLPGDIDGNGAVNGTDLNILINIILGKDNAANYNGRANVNGEGGVDGNDLNKLINIILGK